MQIEQTTIRLPRELKEKLEKQAKTKGYTLKDVVIFILQDYLQNISQE
ncbi:ribbon-helix-helix, copG family protein [Clostridioides difficile DA00203]|nr:ribbon-helix-helix, copG family protein [Clostridioides difficile DA00203]EQJ32379.1 ribbon-helix-helix, copG family protein [Clostridioides difficile P20]